MGVELDAIADATLRELDGRYMGGVSRRPIVDVYAASKDGERLLVHFIFDFALYHYAQSGSDWDTHSIYLGEAVFIKGKLVSKSVSSARELTVQEQQGSTDWYAPEPAMREIREQACAKLASR